MRCSACRGRCRIRGEDEEEIDGDRYGWIERDIDGWMDGEIDRD
jgi:hypothetical protein